VTKLALLAAGIGVLGFVAVAGTARSATVTHVYDVRVTGVFRVTLARPSDPRPLDFGYSQTSTWTETYERVRLEVRASEFTPELIDLRMTGAGTVKGRISYHVSGPGSRSCAWETSRSEPGALTLSGSGYTASAPGPVTYRLNLSTGRRLGSVQPSPADCTYYEGHSAKLANTSVGPGGGKAEGSVDSRSALLVAEYRKPQRPGRLAFPLNRLYAGAGFVLSLKGKTRDHGGRRTSEGTARITFVPRSS
jgi:hypothetical protein